MTPLPYQALKLEIYRDHAAEYDESMRTVVGDETLESRQRWAVEVIEAGQRIVDLGCGTGALLPALADAVGPNGLVAGGDLSPAMLAVAREKGRDASHAVSLLVLDASVHLPFADDSFDCACAFGILQEIPAPRALLEELFRILRPGGAFRGLATTYHTLSEAAEIHMAAAEEMGIFLRPQNTISTMFLQIFGPVAATRWEPNPNLTNPAIWEKMTVEPMRMVIDRVRASGHDPAAVELGVLYMTGRKVG
jgi:ubiquinone/menaquinone biosynthesis C-methylase UbiE